MVEFDEAYVKKLREENASWRTKVRELEAQQNNSVVQVELAKRGVEADPSWVTIEEGKTVEDAVDTLLETYPSLQTKTVEEEPLFDTEEPVRTTVKPLSPSEHKTTTPKPHSPTRITSRNLKEIRDDPKARAKVRSLYRDLLARGSNQGE